MKHHHLLAISQYSDAKVSPFDLIRRRKGWTLQALDDLTRSTDEPLPDLDVAVELLHQAISDQQQITIITDYDMDGVAAGLLAYAGLSELGARVNLVIPHYTGARDVDHTKMDHALRQYPHTSLVVTCDVGINSNEGIDLAQANGVKVIVADHHIEGETPCRADAVVDPNRTDSQYPEPDICGAQVTLHILSTYALAHRADKIQSIKTLSLLGGIGGLADVMPLRGQTRALVRQAVGLLSLAMPEVPVYSEADSKRDEDPVPYYKIGRWNLENPEAIKPENSTLFQIVSGEDHHPIYRDLFYGVSLMLTELILQGKLRGADDINVGFLGFTWTPMFNATRRIEGDMADSFMIFAPTAVRSSRPDFRATQDDTAARIESAQTIIANNELRKKLMKQALVELHERDQPLAPWIWTVPGNTPSGVLGLLASDVMGQTKTPVLVINEDTLSGSARAPEWAPVLDLVKELDRPGLYAAGHQQACGVRAQSMDDLKALARAFHELEQSLPEPDFEASRPDLHLVDIDAVSQISDPESQALISADMTMPVPAELVMLSQQIQALGPFGQGFTEPEIAVTFQPAHARYKFMSLTDEAQAMLDEVAESGDAEALGRAESALGVTDYKHLRVTTGHGFEMVWWNSTDRYEDLISAGMATAMISLSTNTFGGNVRPQGIVRSMDLME